MQSSILRTPSHPSGGTARESSVILGGASSDGIVGSVVGHYATFRTGMAVITMNITVFSRRIDALRLGRG